MFTGVQKKIACIIFLSFAIIGGLWFKAVGLVFFSFVWAYLCFSIFIWRWFYLDVKERQEWDPKAKEFYSRFDLAVGYIGVFIQYLVHRSKKLN